jgi:hypothetical protein
MTSRSTPLSNRPSARPCGEACARPPCAQVPLGRTAGPWPAPRRNSWPRRGNSADARADDGCEVASSPRSQVAACIGHHGSSDPRRGGTGADPARLLRRLGRHQRDHHRTPYLAMLFHGRRVLQDLSLACGRGRRPRVLDRDDRDHVSLLVPDVDEQHPRPGPQDEPEPSPSAFKRGPELGEIGERGERRSDSIDRRRRQAVREDHRPEVGPRRLGDDNARHVATRRPEE